MGEGHLSGSDETLYVYMLPKGRREGITREIRKSRLRIQE
jgi:hypothetical protein